MPHLTFFIQQVKSKEEKQRLEASDDLELEKDFFERRERRSTEGENSLIRFKENEERNLEKSERYVEPRLLEKVELAGKNDSFEEIEKQVERNSVKEFELVGENDLEEKYEKHEERDLVEEMEESANIENGKNCSEE